MSSRAERLGMDPGHIPCVCVEDLKKRPDRTTFFLVSFSV
jgi:hypothetical protein